MYLMPGIPYADRPGQISLKTLSYSISFLISYAWIVLKFIKKLLPGKPLERFSSSSICRNLDSVE